MPSIRGCFFVLDHVFSVYLPFKVSRLSFMFFEYELRFGLINVLESMQLSSQFTIVIYVISLIGAKVFERRGLIFAHTIQTFFGSLKIDENCMECF